MSISRGLISSPLPQAGEGFDDIARSIFCLFARFTLRYSWICFFDEKKMGSLNTNAFEKAVDSLRRSIQVAKHYLADKNTAVDLKETLQAGVIQNFEFCYELSWKMLKRQLEQEAITPSLIDPMSYAEIIRESAEKHLVADAKKWLVYRHHRNKMSHTYNKETAETVYQAALEFYQDVLELLHALQARNT